MANLNFDQYIKDKTVVKPSLADDLEKVDRAMEIAYQIYTLRKAIGLTQTQLAKKIKVSQSNIARIESADYNHYSMKTLDKVAKGLGADLNIFINEPQQTMKLVTAFKSTPLFQPFTFSSISGGYSTSGWLSLHSEDLFNIKGQQENFSKMRIDSMSQEAEANKYYYQTL